MLRFLHGGDFHLDSPFRSLSPDEAVNARAQQRALLERFGALAQEEGIDLIFLSGDLFDGARIYPETLKALRQMLASLPCPVFIAPGNHDPYTKDSPYQRFTWPSHVHIFSQEQVTSVELPELGCTVHGSAFLSHHRSRSPLEGIGAAVQGEGLHFGCFHGEVTQGLSRYGPILPSQLAASGLHYAALGHIHSKSGLSQTGSTYYAYPGCPQGRGFDETGEKGVFLGTSDGKNLSLQFQPICTHQYRIFSLDITGKDPVAALKSSLPKESADIVRILLKGEREEEDLPLALLQKLAHPHFFAVELLDETHLPSSLWARQKEESLTGLFLREMALRMEKADANERAQIELALRFGLAALEGREVPE